MALRPDGQLTHVMYYEGAHTLACDLGFVTPRAEGLGGTARTTDSLGDGPRRPVGSTIALALSRSRGIAPTGSVW